MVIKWIHNETQKRLEKDIGNFHSVLPVHNQCFLTVQQDLR